MTAADDPSAVLRAAAARWTQQRGGDIVAEVEPAHLCCMAKPDPGQACPHGVGYWFSFVVPALGGYRYRLFRAEHGVYEYPLFIAGGRAPEDPPERVEDDEALLEAVGRLLDAPMTREAVRQIEGMIAEQCAPAGKGPA